MCPLSKMVKQANYDDLCYLVNGPFGNARIETIMKNTKTPQIPVKMFPLWKKDK
jgi:hypothetical protein